MSRDSTSIAKSADELTKTSEANPIELTEGELADAELAKVSGGQHKHLAGVKYESIEVSSATKTV